MQKLLNAINSQELLNQESQYIQLALNTNDLKKRFKYYQQAKSIHKIATELQKWETTTRGY